MCVWCVVIRWSWHELTSSGAYDVLCRVSIQQMHHDRDEGLLAAAEDAPSDHSGSSETIPASTAREDAETEGLRQRRGGAGVSDAEGSGSAANSESSGPRVPRDSVEGRVEYIVGLMHEGLRKAPSAYLHMTMAIYQRSLTQVCVYSMQPPTEYLTVNATGRAAPVCRY